MLFEKLHDEIHLALACLPKLLTGKVAGKVFTKQILRLEIYKRNKSLHVKRKPHSGILCIMHLKLVRVLAAVDWEIKLGADDSDHRVTPGWCPQPSLSFYSVALGFFCGVEGVQMLNRSSVRTFLKSQCIFQEIPIVGKTSKY